MNLNKPSFPEQATQDHSAVTPAKTGNLQRLPTVEERTGLKKSTIYAGVKAGTFPAPVRLSARAVAFRSEDIDQWITERSNVGAK